MTNCSRYTRLYVQCGNVLGTSEHYMESASQDWKHFKRVGYIAIRLRRRLSVTNESPLDCVGFIFYPSNSQLLATGSKKTKMRDGEAIDIPAVRRTKIDYMY